MRCDRAPEGWTCRRDAGHDGPCAAAPVGVVGGYLADNAMVSVEGGTVYLADSQDDALYFYAMHGARPANPERFPWRCPETTRLWTSPGEFGEPVNVQCVLVNLHGGDCRAEVTW